MDKINQSADFNKKLIKLGIISLVFAVVANFIPAIYLWLAYGLIPSVSDIFKIWGLALASLGISWVIQPIAYYSILGTSGTYIAWLAGSVADIRLPAVTMAQKVSGVEAGTHEGDVMSTIGIASSVLISVVFITIFTLIGSKVLTMLPKFVIDSFKYILPALFGAVYIEMSRKNFKAGILTLVLGIVLMLTANALKFNAALMTIVVVACGILVCRILFVMDKKKNLT